MQARNHENSDEIRPTPVRHLDLATPAFYTYRKNPKCYHTVWGKMPRVQMLDEIDIDISALHLGYGGTFSQNRRVRAKVFAFTENQEMLVSTSVTDFY